MTDNVTQLSETKVSKATDISKTSALDLYENPLANKAFIQYLIDRGMEVSMINNDLFIMRLANKYNGIEFNGSRIKCVEFQEDNLKEVFDFESPNTLDQFKMILACAGIIQLSKNYQSDEDRLNKVRLLIKAKIDVARTLMQGADNSEFFNTANAVHIQLTDIKRSIEEILTK